MAKINFIMAATRLLGDRYNPHQEEALQHENQ